MTVTARWLVVAYVALFGLLNLSVLLPGNPYWDWTGDSGDIVALVIEVLIVWGLWRGSLFAWSVALLMSVFTILSVMMVDPGLEVGVVVFLVIAFAQLAVLLLLRTHRVMHLASTPSDLDPFGR